MRVGDMLIRSRPWVPISSPSTHMVYLLLLLSYLAGSKSVSARSTRIWWQILLQKLQLRRAANIGTLFWLFRDINIAQKHHNTIRCIQINVCHRNFKIILLLRPRIILRAQPTEIAMSVYPDDLPHCVQRPNGARWARGVHKSSILIKSTFQLV